MIRQIVQQFVAIGKARREWIDAKETNAIQWMCRSDDVVVPLAFLLLVGGGTFGVCVWTALSMPAQARAAIEPTLPAAMPCAPDPSNTVLLETSTGLPFSSTSSSPSRSRIIRANRGAAVRRGP